jgi:hypothetical protein
MTRLTIILVGYNSRTELDTALRSLTEPPPRVGHEIVVVDNASTDGSVDGFSRRWPGVRLMTAPANLGFAAANNRAASETAGELILFMNPDTVMPEGGVDRLVSIVDARPDVAIVGPRLVDARARAELSFGPMVAPWTELRQKVLVAGHDRGLWPWTALVERMTKRARQVDWVSGACLLIRRQDLEAAGGFDERFFMYLEDVDLCAAVRARGRSVLFSADPTVVHFRGRSAATAPKTTQDAYRRSQVAFYLKHHPALVGLLRVYLKLRGQLPDTRS